MGNRSLYGCGLYGQAGREFGLGGFDDYVFDPERGAGGGPV